MSPWLFNAEKKLKAADEDLARGLYYDAMRAYKQILKKEKNNTMVLGQADAGLRKARQGLMELQTAEAKKFLDEGDGVQAAECCRNAIDLAGTDLRAKEAEKILATLLQGSTEEEDVTSPDVSVRTEGIPEERVATSQEIEDADRETERQEERVASPTGIEKEDLFRLYLESLPEDRAEILANFGPEFRDGYVLTQQGKPEEALERYEEAPSLAARHPIFLFHKSQALYSCGRDKEALEILESLDLPEDLRRLRAELRTVLYWRLDEAEKSEAEARELHSMTPDDITTAHLYAQVLTSNGKHKEALDILIPWVDPVQVIPQIDRLVIQLCLELDLIDDAMDLLEKAVNRYFHDSLSMPAEGQLGRVFGAGPGVSPSVAPEPSESFPLWAARKLLDLYIEHDVGPDEVGKLVETLVMFDPESEVEYRDRLSRYLDEEE
jgi:tetratricopeptide (TPR) repeat protein